MKMRFFLAAAVGVSATFLVAGAQTPAPVSGAPTTQPASADQMLNRVLRPVAQPARPLQPLPDPPAIDATSGKGAVAPKAPQVQVLREGTYLVDRVGRLQKAEDGEQYEFVFDADGQALRDPPVILLPNLKLMTMESRAQASTREVRFRVTGMLTEYKNRNYLLLDKVLVLPEDK